MDEKKKNANKKWLWFVAGGGILLTCLCLMVIVLMAVPGSTDKSTQVAGAAVQNTKAPLPAPGKTNLPAPTQTPAPTKTPAPSRTPAPTRTPTETPDPNLIKPGTYLLGTDIQPGIYWGEGPCYWERLKDLSGSFDGIIANGNAVGQFYVELKDSDNAFSTDCSIVPLEALPAPSGEPLQTFEPGVYLVGRDIQPGVYRGEGSCYYERLKNVAGGFDAILANGNAVGQFYIEVKDSDYALSTGCKIVSLETLPAPSGDPKQPLDPGMYLVGRDIQPGTYKGQGDSCYWERLKSVAGGFDAIITNGNENGQFYIQVQPSDYALSTNCEIALAGD